MFTITGLETKREELEVRLLTSNDERTKELLRDCIRDLRDTIQKLKEGE